MHCLHSTMMAMILELRVIADNDDTCIIALNLYYANMQSLAQWKQQINYVK